MRLRGRINSLIKYFAFLFLSACGVSTEQAYFSMFAVKERFDPKATIAMRSAKIEKIDLLWVVDSSGSMADEQASLSTNFHAFAQNYLARGWDFRTSVITTDVYLARQTNNAAYGANNAHDYAKLLPGIHDGIRPPVNSGVRSGLPILDVVSNLSLQQLVDAFVINAKPGITGSGSERGLESTITFLNQNEIEDGCSGDTPAANCFFRKDSARIFAFVSDECDSSYKQNRPANEKNLDCGQLAVRTDFLQSVKTQWDDYLRALNSPGKLDPRYYTISIINQTPLNGDNQFYGKELSAFTDLVKADNSNILGKYSTTSNINGNFATILDDIGAQLEQVIQTQVSVNEFTLQRDPTGIADMKMVLVFADGSQFVVPQSEYTVVGRLVSINTNYLNGMSSTFGEIRDVFIEYTPAKAG